MIDLFLRFAQVLHLEVNPEQEDLHTDYTKAIENYSIERLKGLMKNDCILRLFTVFRVSGQMEECANFFQVMRKNKESFFD